MWVYQKSIIIQETKLKIKINKTLDMYDNIFHCDTHNVDFNMLLICKHFDCKPTPSTKIIIPWFELFRKCMNIKTAPNITDLLEGIYSEQWLKNESDRVKLYDDMTKELKNEKLKDELTNQENSI
jgi:hypothetical protein